MTRPPARGRPRLWIVARPSVTVRSTTSQQGLDPATQARLLCVLITEAVPSGTVKAFAEMTGADYERITDVGMNAARVARTEFIGSNTSRRRPPLTYEQAIEVRRLHKDEGISQMALSNMFDVTRDEVRKALREKIS